MLPLHEVNEGMPWLEEKGVTLCAIVVLNEINIICIFGSFEIFLKILIRNTEITCSYLSVLLHLSHNCISEQFLLLFIILERHLALFHCNTWFKLRRVQPSWTIIEKYLEGFVVLQLLSNEKGSILTHTGQSCRCAWHDCNLFLLASQTTPPPDPPAHRTTAVTDIFPILFTMMYEKDNKWNKGKNIDPQRTLCRTIQPFSETNETLSST